jgi:medium-chain acyl-[acyl-carrier-protein] hydrolase
MENTKSRTVGYSLLDRNGHMNNTRYMEWVYDLLDSDFHRAHPVREFTVCYMNEAREGDDIALHYELTDGPVLTVDATREGERIFSAQMLY